MISSWRGSTKICGISATGWTPSRENEQTQELPVSMAEQTRTAQGQVGIMNSSASRNGMLARENGK